jgi:hypothetical protein
MPADPRQTVLTLAPGSKPERQHYRAFTPYYC